MPLTNHFRYLILVACFATVSCATTSNESTAEAGKGAAKSGLVLNKLLKSDLAGVDDTEVILAHVTIPPHTTLPKHWHPGEEFGYVLEGAVTLWQKGKRDTHLKAGDSLKVPLKQVHTAKTGAEGVKLIVFRVHEKGQPERVLAD